MTEQDETIFEQAGADDVDKTLDWARTTHPSLFRNAVAKQTEGDIGNLIQLAHQFVHLPANTPSLDEFQDVDPSNFSDKQLINVVNSYPLPEGVRVCMQVHVAYIETPEYEKLPLGTLMESGDVTFYQ